jgi:hypothetical protein
MGGGGEDFGAQQAAAEQKKQRARDALNLQFGVAPDPSTVDRSIFTHTTPGVATGSGQDFGGYTPETSTFDQAGYDAAVAENAGLGAEAEKNKAARESLYSTVRNDAFGAGRRKLDEAKTNAARDLRFTLFGQGLNGGSADIDENARLGQTYNQGLLDLGGKADAAAADLRGNDEQTRLGLLQAIDSGLDQSSATSSSLAQLKANSDRAAAQGQGTDLGDLFGNAGLLYTKSQAGRGAFAARPTSARNWAASSVPAASRTTGRRARQGDDMTGVEEAAALSAAAGGTALRPPTGVSPRRSLPPWRSRSAAPARASPHQQQQASERRDIANKQMERTLRAQEGADAKINAEGKQYAPDARAAALEGQQQATFDQAQKDLGSAPTIIEGAGDTGNVSSDYLNAKAGTALTEGNRLTAIARELSKTRAPGQLMTAEGLRRANLTGELSDIWGTDRRAANAAQLDAQNVEEPLYGSLGKIASAAGGAYLASGAGAAAPVGGRRRWRHGAAGGRLPCVDHRRGALRPAARRAVHLRPHRWPDPLRPLTCRAAPSPSRRAAGRDARPVAPGRRARRGAPTTPATTRA